MDVTRDNCHAMASAVNKHTQHHHHHHRNHRYLLLLLPILCFCRRKSRHLSVFADGGSEERNTGGRVRTFVSALCIL